MMPSCWWWVSWVTSGKNGLSRTKVEGFLPKRKIFRSENHKKFEKKAKNRQKRRQKSDRLSLFKLTFVVFIGTQKKRQKCDKSDKMSLFQFVGGHPRVKLFLFYMKLLAGVFWSWRMGRRARRYEKEGEKGAKAEKEARRARTHSRNGRLRRSERKVSRNCERNRRTWLSGWHGWRYWLQIQIQVQNFIIFCLENDFFSREVEKEDYGLTADELLNATDAELNQWVGLKRVTQWKGTKQTLKLRVIFRV